MKLGRSGGRDRRAGGSGARGSSGSSRLFPWSRGGRRAAWRVVQLRKGLAAVAVALAVWVALQALSPEPPAREQAVVAAADLAAGHRLTPSDVTLAPIHPESTPRSRTSDPGTVVGQTLGQPVEAGEVLTAARLRPARGLAALPPGRRALHVPVVDAGAVGLVRPGDRVDVIAVSAGQTVGSDLLVLSVDAPSEGGSGLTGSGGDGPAGVVLAATEQDVTRIVPASAGGVADGGQIAVKSDK